MSSSPIKFGRSTEFLNVDLDLRSSSGLKVIVRAIGHKMLVLNSSAGFASLELATQPRTAEDAVRRIAQIVNSLPVEGRRSWDRCKSRHLNIGIQAGHGPHERHFRLSRTALAHALGIRAAILITIYAPPKKGPSIPGRKEAGKVIAPKKSR